MVWVYPVSELSKKELGGQCMAGSIGRRPGRGGSKGAGVATAPSETSAPLPPVAPMKKQSISISRIYKTPRIYVTHHAQKSPKLTYNLIKTLELLTLNLVLNTNA